MMAKMFYTLEDVKAALGKDDDGSRPSRVTGGCANSATARG